nr:MAG TPA: hypothetical protein [Microviridae sp.]
MQRVSNLSESCSLSSLLYTPSFDSLYIWRSLHEFAQRESDLTHRFQSFLVLYTQTHRPACHPSSLLFIYVNNLYEHLFFLNLYLYLCIVFKNNVHFKFFKFMEKYYLCSIQSKVNPNQNETVLVSVDEVSAFVSSNLRPNCILLISQCSTFKAIPDEK